ncbi:putative protein phosphatase 2C 38 [Glycine max]|nr:putative protein phosphatase 2C 38 [Glycine max]
MKVPEMILRILVKPGVSDEKLPTKPHINKTTPLNTLPELLRRVSINRASFLLLFLKYHTVKITCHSPRTIHGRADVRQILRSQISEMGFRTRINNILLIIIYKISRSIGDAYLKKAEFNKAPLLAKFRLSEPFDQPILKVESAILVQKLCPHDLFLILASDGLWEQMSNQEAVNINWNETFVII